MRNFVLSGLMILAVALKLWAVDGIAVTVRNWTGYSQGIALDGDIYRIDIKNSDTVKSTKLVSGPASVPHISPDGKRVAFIKPVTAANGSVRSEVCVIGIDGGTITELSPCERRSCLDFPNNNWIYWQNGADVNLSSESGNADSCTYIFRVNANGGLARELVANLKSPDGHMVGLLGEGISVDTGLTRCCVHPAYGGANGGYTVYFFSWGTSEWRTAYTLMGCGGGMSFDGHYLFQGLQSHQDYNIVNINFPGGFADSALNGNSYTPRTGSQVKFFACGDPVHFYYNNGGATNDTAWICRGMQYPAQLGYSPAQRLSNWVTGEQFYVGVGDAGDFWVGSASQNTAMAFNPSQLSFAATKGSSSPAAQTVQITNSGNGTLNTVTTSINYTSG
ncbi:MAG: hypothetical protein PHC61_15960, partial [Chitinivibrionales bacterium]|nr:hypothetical protein [Chitinivibrionales bacterium]